jgi:hypothetical protein
VSPASATFAHAGVLAGRWPGRLCAGDVGLSARAHRCAKVSRFIKAELKRADMTYAELAEKLKDHGLQNETEASVKAKLKRGTFAATFFLAVIAALEMEGVQIGDI